MEEAEGRISVTEDGCGMVQHSPPWRRQWNSSAGKWMMENQVWHKNLKIVNFPEKAEEAPPLGASSSHCYHFWSACPPTFPRWRLNALIAHLHQTQPRNKPSRSILVQFLQYSQREGVLKATLKKQDILYEGSRLRFYPDLSAEVLQRCCEFDTGGKMMVRHSMYCGFTYPAHLRCLHEGWIHLFDSPKSAAAFWETLEE